MLRRDAAATVKDRLTIDWFTKTVGELRAEIAELQQATKNTTRAVQQRDPLHEDVAELQYDQRQMRLTMDALHSRQETTEREVKELRSEALQNGEDLRSRLHRLHQPHASKVSGGCSDWKRNFDKRPAPARVGVARKLIKKWLLSGHGVQARRRCAPFCTACH